MLQMLRLGAAENKNVIEKDQYSPTQERPKDLVHESLERGRSVCEAEWHHLKLVMAMVCAECRLGRIVGMHTDLMISAAEVELGEEDGILEFIQELLHDRYGKLVPDGLAVESPVVYAEAPRAVALADQQDRRRERRCTRPYDALFQHRLALGLNFVLQELDVSVWTHCDRRCVWQQMNPMVQGPWRWQSHRSREKVI